MNMREIDDPELAEALSDFVAMVDFTGPGPWNHMTCHEAEVLAGLMRVLGRADLADFVIRDHAEGDDDEDDDHHEQYLETHEG